MRFLISIVLIITLTGCASSQAGPFGINGVFGEGNLAKAQPLFDRHEEECLGSAHQLLNLMQSGNSSENSRPEKKEIKDVECEEIWSSFRDLLGDPKPPLISFEDATARQKKATANLQTAAAALKALDSDTNRKRLAGAKKNSVVADGLVKISSSKAERSTNMLNYNEHQRNEIIDALLAASNQKCNNYTALIKNTDGAVNAGLSVSAIITGGLGSILGGPNTARVFSGTSSILGGSRAAINETYLSNQTIHVLSAAFQNRRRISRQAILNRQACTVTEYTLMRGLEDAFDYHSSCSIVAGLEEAARTIERSANPGMEEMSRQLFLLAQLRNQAQKIGGDEDLDPFQEMSAFNLADLNIANTELQQKLSEIADVQKSIDEAKVKENPNDAEKKMISDLEETLKKLNSESQQFRIKLEKAASKMLGRLVNNEAPTGGETRICPYSKMGAL